MNTSSLPAQSLQPKPTSPSEPLARSSWSLYVGRPFGIPTFIHATFWLLIGWVALSHWLREKTPQAVGVGVAFILAMFACVLLHELGHALMARRYGIGTRDITLLPIGGLARLEKMPDKPQQELWVALAGPAVNVVIAGVLWAWLQVVGGWEPVANLSVDRGSFVERLMIVNLFLVGFNLLPAFPMDGGRVLRALLALRLDYAHATRIAALVGQAMALLFGLMGLFGNPFLLFIAFFVWIGASQEAGQAQARSELAGQTVARAMMTDFQTLQPNDPLSRATELVLSGSQHDFPVLNEAGGVAGVLTRTALMQALARGGAQTSVGEIMQREFALADAGEELESAFLRLAQSPCPVAPVLQNGVLVGLLSGENVGEFLMIQAALRAPNAPIENAKPKTV